MIVMKGALIELSRATEWHSTRPVCCPSDSKWRFPRGDLHKPEFEFLRGKKNKKQNESLWKIPLHHGVAGQFTQVQTGGRAEYKLHVIKVSLHR